jgi:hypothetical protein
MSRRQAAFAGAVLLALALTACSGPSSPAPSSTSPNSGPGGASTSTTSPASPDASADPATDPAASPAAGGFNSVPEACAAVSGTAVSLLALPKAAAGSQDSAEAQKARTELEEVRGRVPAGLKEHFEKLKSIADHAGPDYSKFNRTEFDSALAPVAGWLEAHC